MTTVKAKPETVQAAYERRLVIYAPTKKVAEEWTRIAKEHHHIPFSKWVVQLIQSSLKAEEKDEAYREVLRSRNELRQKVAELSEQSNRDKIVIKALERELKDLRAQPFLDEGFRGKRAFPKDLIVLLKGGKVRYEDLHSRLGIDPGSDASKALQVQLNILEQYGLIELTDRYVRWRE